MKTATPCKTLAVEMHMQKDLKQRTVQAVEDGVTLSCSTRRCN